MNILVIGSGAREHAIAWKLGFSSKVDRIYVAPGNAGTAQLATNLPISPTNLEGLVEAALSYQIDLTVVGPEIPLAQGIVDQFTELGLRIFGPTKAAARIETSKSFAKELMFKNRIPTGTMQAFDSYREAKEYLERVDLPLVLKADGLATGKGVTICRTRDEAFRALHRTMVERCFGAAGDRILVEEFLEGQEISVFAFTDGVHLSSLVAACDYKRALDNNRGPNTGGMGSYSPPTIWNDTLETQVRNTIMKPIVSALAKAGAPFHGTLYAGLILTENGPKVLEFNCRLGDPETQVVLPRLNSDLLDVLLGVVAGTLDRCKVEWEGKPCVGVVLASGGYPEKYTQGHAIQGLEAISSPVLAFHSGTRIETDRQGTDTRTITDGGRVLTLVAQADSLEAARAKVYNAVRKVEFEDIHYRTDIAQSD